MDYENIKNNQILKRTDRMQYELQARNLVERSQLDKVVKEYESQIERLENKLINTESNPFDKLAREKMENEVDQLRAENAMMAK